MTPDKALKHAETVYQRLIAQGRSDADARRDAERWVEGNLGVKVKLDPPSRVPTHDPDDPWNSHPWAGGFTVHFTTSTSTNTSSSVEDILRRAGMDDYWRDLVEQQVRERESRRDTIKRDIDRLMTEHDDLIQQVESLLGRYPKQPGDFARISSMLKQIARLEERIERYKRQYDNA